MSRVDNSSDFSVISRLIMKFKSSELADALQMIHGELRHEELCLAPWAPSGDDREIFSRLFPALNLRKLRGSEDPVDKVKRLWIYCFYSKYLKPNRFTRQMVNFLWRNLFLSFLKHKSDLFGRYRVRHWCTVMKLRDYVELSSLSTTKVFDAVRIKACKTKVIPAKDLPYLDHPQDYYLFPPVYIAEIGDGIVYGGTNLVFVQDVVICHDLYDFDRDYTSEEFHGRHELDPGKMRIRLLRRDALAEIIPAAAVFVDACAANYAHWLSEVLPRIASFCSIVKFEKIPIIVNDGLHANIMDSLSAVVGSEREVIMLPVGVGIQVRTLYVTSVTGYVPFGKRGKLLDHNHGLFHPSALDLLRRQIFKFTDKLQPIVSPKKIYLRRNSDVRKLINSLEIECQFALHGYQFVDVERLTFLEQVNLFVNADEIVAPTGAGLVNAIFCKPETRITIFMSKHENMIYRYWLSMYATFNFAITNILGRIEKNYHRGIHGDYSLALSDISEFLNSNGGDK